MSIGNAGVAMAASLAGAQQAERNSGATDRAVADAKNQERHSTSMERADRSAGVGSSDEASTAAGDRDADGRRPWERIRRPGRAAEEGDEPKSKDTSGQLGQTLDLSG